MNTDLGLACWVPPASWSINTFGMIITGNPGILSFNMSIIEPIGYLTFYIYIKIGEGHSGEGQFPRETPILFRFIPSSPHLPLPLP